MHSEFSAKLTDKLKLSLAPVSYSALKKAFVSVKSGVNEELLKQTLSEGVNAQHIFRWPDFGGAKQRYSHVPAEPAFQEAVVRGCSEMARPKAEITGKGFGKSYTSEHLADVIASGAIRKYPAIVGRAELWASTPEAYLAYLLNFVAAKLKKAGIPDAQFFTQNSAVAKAPEFRVEDIAHEIVKKLPKEHHVPISTARLRRELSLMDEKAKFDEAALHLWNDKRVYLTAHHNPLGLPQEDRDLLVDGKDGAYYVAITLRTD